MGSRSEEVIKIPFQSKAQKGWMFANKPNMAKRWVKDTPDIKGLPDVLGKKKKKGKMKDILS